MKIFYSLPEEMDKGDVYILGIVRIGVIGFLLVSSLTVFGGFRSYSSAYMSELYSLLAWLLLFFGYWAFCFVPDFVNSMMVRYISRTVLKRSFVGDPRTVVVLLASLGLVFFLTRYSYKMSQFAAGKTGRDMGGEIDRTDLVAFDSTYMLRFDKLQGDYEQEKAEINERYEQLVQEAAGELNAKIEGEQTLMAGLEQNRKKSNTIWTDQQIRVHQRRIADYEKRKRPIVSPIRAEQAEKLRVLEERMTQQQGLLSTSYTITRDTTLKQEGNAGHIHASEVSFFSKQLSGIAGNAIFFLLVLTVIREIIYDRNDIDPDPVFSPFDFQPSVVVEVVAYPFVRVGRGIVNWVREGYNGLPELVERDDFRELRDPGQRQKVLKSGKGGSGKAEGGKGNSETTESGNGKSESERKSEGGSGKEEKAEGGNGKAESVEKSESSEIEESEKSEIPETREEETSERKTTETSESGKGKSESETTEIPETSERQIEEIPETKSAPKSKIPETEKKAKLRKREKAGDSSKERTSNRKSISVKRGNSGNEITDIEKGKDGKILKVRIGYKWYTYYELGKRIYDFRNAAESASKESTRERNLHKIEVFERARRLFENTKTMETPKNGKNSRAEDIESLSEQLKEANERKLSEAVIEELEERLRELGVESVREE